MGALLSQICDSLTGGKLVFCLRDDCAPAAVYTPLPVPLRLFRLKTPLNIRPGINVAAFIDPFADLGLAWLGHEFDYY
jgi:hypothetical protein